MHRSTRKQWMPFVVGLITSLLIVIGVMFLGDAVFAQVDQFGVDQVDQTIELTGTDIRVVIARILRVALSLLGIVVISLIIYGGVVYMTAAGNEDRVARAKKIILNAVIGLAIIFSSLAITQFVINTLGGAVRGGEVVDEEEDPRQNCEDDEYFRQHEFFCREQLCEEDHFVITSITPSTPGNPIDPTDMNNIVMRAVFSWRVHEDTDFDSALQVTRGNETIPVTGRLLDGGKVIEAIFSADEACIADQTCLDPGVYTITVDPSVRSEEDDERELEIDTDCGDYPNVSRFTVNTEDIIDVDAPVIEDVLINNQDGDTIVLPRGRLYPIRTQVTDFVSNNREFTAGTSYVHIRVYDEEDQNDTVTEWYGGPDIDNGSSVPFDVEYGLVVGNSFESLHHYIVEVTAYDIDHNESVKTAAFTVVGSQCDDENNEDFDECLVDDGQCQENWQCQSQVCNEGQCVPFPMITDVSPWDGAAGNWVSILGQYFGTNPGQVEFGVDITGDGTFTEEDAWVPAVLPSQCGGAWGDNIVVTEVPERFSFAPKFSLERSTYAIIPDADILSPTEALSVEFWVKSTLPNQVGSNVIRKEGVFAIGVVNPNSLILGRTWKDDNGLVNISKAGVNADFGEWRHVVLTTDRNNIVLYVDGEEVRRLPFNAGIPDTDAPIIIGARNQSHDFFDGSVDELRIYNRALSGAEINAHIAHTFTDENTAGLVGYWPLDEREGTTFADESGNNNNGTYFRNVELGEISPVGSYFVPGDEASIRITRANDETLRDSSTNDHGPKPGPNQGKFTKNTTQRPGLCRVETLDTHISVAPAGTRVQAIGQGFSDNLNENSVTFGGVPSIITDIRDEDSLSFAQTRVPDNLNGGRIAVQVTVNGEQSNGVPFVVLSDEDGDLTPIITEIDPDETTKRSYITIHGERFGNTPGFVYLGSSAEEVRRCAEERNQDNTCIVLDIDLPNCGGATWRTNQIIVGVPNTAQIREYALLVQRADSVYSDGQDALTVVEGEPKPSICALDPASGPAPLAEGADPIRIRGANFANNASVHFFWRGADRQDVATWLSSENDTVPPNNGAVIQERTGNVQIDVLLPANEQGNSMSTGPIKVQVGNQVSNGINYEVGSCTEDGVPPQDGYHCCAEGPDQGLWKPEDYICEGQTREAGYVWRFTTGKIFTAPDVIERCDNSPLNGDEPVQLPSPSPWVGHSSQSVCRNAQITVQFTKEMNENSLRNNVAVYSCGQEDEPDCSERELTPNLEIPETFPADALFISHQEGTVFDANTWYQVELGRGIVSQEQEFLFGQWVESNQPLIERRSCGNDTAYCFVFKTNARTCNLAGAGIQPSSYIARALGTLHDPRFIIDAQNREAHPLYYYVWGRADEQCIALDVDQYNWSWGPTGGEDNRAYSTKAVGDGHQNDRATVTALRHTAPEAVDITAETVVRQTDENNNETIERINGVSPLVINLEEPRVVDFWPNCVEACSNAVIGIAFNRAMAISTYGNTHEGLVINECANEFCNEEEINDEPVQLDEVLADDPFQYRVRPRGQFQENTWYLARVLPTIRAIEQLEPLRIGSAVTSTSWKFRVKAEDGFCAVDRVRIEPNPFNAIEIGQKTSYKATPHGAPDECSPFGQELDPLAYGWNWSTQNAEVADITHFETVGNLSEYCTAGCTSIGSNIPRSTENPRICGNGVVDLGEDCDIQDIVRFKDGNPRLINDTPVGEVVGESCSLNCLRPGSAAPFCGNGIIEPEQGEECDPEDPNDPSEGRFCDPIRCLNIGTSSREPEGDVGQSWCGSGFVTAGEDCDIADGRIGCSPICLHTGTPLAVSWCDEFGQDLEVCNNAVSVCGNQVVESGEQCEIIREVQPGLFLMAFPNGEQGISVTRGSECNDGCLLENICEGPSIPSSLRCTAGEPGCNDDCTYAGSSIGYENPSVCGDGIQGVGEYVGCEDPNQQGNNRLEEHPIQIVTAIGQGNPEEFPTIQFTEISVEANSIERPPTEDRPLITVDDITPPVEGTGDYFLQCGYEEFDEQVNGQFNNCPNAEDGVASNSCCYPRPRRSASYPRDLAGIGNEEGVCRNTFISVSFDEVIDEETLNGNVWIAKGYEDAVNCRDISDGREVDVTGELQETLVGVLLEDTPPETLFAKVWWHAKKAFYTIVGRKAQASQINNNALNIETWCSGEIAPQPHVIYDQEGDSVTTTVELYLEDLLEADTTYAIILRGGLEGITDVNDVGIGNPDNTNLLHDSVIFRTTEEVCKLADLDVDPPQHLFSVPETGQEFVVESRSSNGQRIVPIEDVYNWTWDWGPKNHNIFEIPFAPATTTEAFTLIGSRTVEGQGIGVASATVIQDRTPDSHEGRVFTGVTQLTSLFCERPWPVHNVFPYEDGNPPGRELNDDEYAPNEFDILPDEGFRGGEAPSVFGKFYNFSLNYCADAGRQGVSDDDLPYLRPFVFTPEFSDTVKQCAHGDNVGEACSADGDCFNRVCSENDALSCTDDSSCAVTEDFGPCLVDQNFCELADIFCTEDIECIDFQSYGQCGAGENTLNACQSVRSLPNEVQKRWLMFNEVNNDVVGVQIFDNPGRLSAARWYQDQGIRDITFQNISDFVVIAVDGFDAITDGDNFYINALNKVNQGVVENYILHISVNENAREDTREVVEKLIDSLQFNINVSDYGFCLAEGTEIIDSALEFISENSLANITTDTCVTDFDCRDAGGSPLPQTIGVCSNARTKFLRDWERLQDVAPVQNAFEQFKRNEGTYPQLESGTFIPRYTNSRWPSWGLLGQSIGGAPSDQINEWSACGVCSDRVNDQATFCVSNADCPGSGNACELKDARTCWDVASSQYMCPLAASVYEYEAIDEENYSLHVPLEYFGNQNTVVEEFVPDQESFTTERWCQPGQIISPFGEACGDGIVNQVSEQCDPPGSRILSSQGYYPTEEGLCNYDNTQTSCSTDADCPISLLEEGVNFADVPETEVCLVDNEIIFTERNENEIDGVFQCNSTDACRDIRTYSEEGLPTAVSVLSNPIRQETIDATLLENPFQRTRFTCGAIKDSESYLGLNLETTQCVGAQEGEVGLCREGDVGVGICNNECQYVYGSCREIFECGNGVVEGDEACDDGSVNGEYGQCNSQCTGFSGVARCGDGQINIDQDTNQPLEHCEIIEDTHVTLNSGANKIRVIYPQLLEESSGSDIIIRMCNNEGIILCERAFIEFGSLFQNIEDIKDEESYQTHYCSGDPQLRCDIERGNADCTAPSPDNVIDLLDNEITRNDVREKVLPVDELVSYGDCVEAGTNRYGSSYHHFEGVSCSEDCQRAGGYCGDGIIESVESCDDGNNVDGDGCSAICQIEEGENNNQNNNQQEVRCDDGIVQAERGEVCDLGVENGIACVPGYDESCTYCSDDCREVLQVDSPLFCGNNDIEDIEVCEFIDNTVTYRKQYCQFEDEVLDTLCTQNSECHGTCFALGGICVLGDRVWAAGCNTDQECTQEELFCGVELSEEVFTEGCADVGEYSCNNSCTNVTNDCLSCNLVSPPGGTVPRAKFINPLFGHQEFDEEDNWSGRATVRLFREQGGFFNPLNQRIWQGSHITIGSDYEVTLLGSEEARIETNVRCSGEYEVEFNRSRVSLGEYNEFLYPVRGQAEAITNEFIASPAVPEGTFRVVLRWTNDEGGENAPFLLNVYNQEFNDRVFGGFPKVLGYPIDTSNPFVSEISGSLGLSENPNYSNYWWPTDNMHQWYEHVYAHREQSLDNTFIQSFTIETDKPQGEGSVENATYAIFVGTDGVPIFGHIHSNLQVEVYEYNERQNPRYSIYKPAHTFEIRGAAGTSSNEVARYWHAFNLVKKNGGYEVEVVKEGNREYEDGTIESGFQDVKCNISTEFCNDSENENEQNQEG